MLLGNQEKTRYYVVENLTSIWMAYSEGRWRIFLGHGGSGGIAAYRSEEECRKALEGFANAYHKADVYVMPKQKLQNTDALDGLNII